MEHFLSPRRTMASLRNTGVTVASLLLAPCLILLLPIVLLIFTPFLLLRWSVKKLAPYLDPSLGEMLRPVDTGVASHTTYSNPYSIVLQTLYLSENCDRDQVIRFATEQILGFKGTCVYPELKQKIVTRFGFKFWQNLPPNRFSVGDHVRYYFQRGDEEFMERSVNHDELLSISENLLKEPFDPRRSPWEFVLVRNFRDDRKPEVKSVIFLRAHHCFFDGYGVVNFLAHFCSTPPQYDYKMPERKKISLWTRLGWELMTSLQVPYELVKCVLGQDRNFYTDTSKNCAVGHRRMHECYPVEMSDLKRIKNRFGVSMTCAVYTTFIGGFIEFMKKKNQRVDQVRNAIPVMTEENADVLYNRFAACMMDIEINEDNILATMNFIERELHGLKYSGKVKAYQALTSLLGRLPASLTPNPNNAPKTTFLISNFPGPSEKFDFCGYNVEQVGSSFKPGPGVGIACVAFGYRGKFKYTLMADANIFTNVSDMEGFSKGIKDTVKFLLSATPPPNSKIKEK